MIFTLLDQLRAETIELIGQPLGRDAFAYGDAHGCMRTVEAMRERLNALVEESSRGESE